MAAVSGVREALAAARSALRAATLRGDGGRAALERHADHVDRVVREVFIAATPSPTPVAVLALGGYGRRHLCLHSDIDLLVLFSGTIAAAEETFLREFLNPLWDLGVVVGHQVREIDEFTRPDQDNPEFLLALLDARLVAGPRDLFDRFTTTFHTPSTHACVLAALSRLVDERHGRFNATLYQLEPDVKEAPGALRDLAATRTIAMLTDPLLLRRGPADPERIREAEDFFLRVRSALHLASDRNANVLSHELQERTAESLGYPGTEARVRVERLMSDYFRHARIVSRCLAWARKTAPIPVGPNLGLSRDGVRFLDPVLAARSPTSWLSAFQAALDAGVEVADDALSCIQQHVDRYRVEDFFGEASDREAFVRLLVPRPGLYARLSEMHDCGLLGRLVPEFQAIACRVVRDFYHKYTVDEHTLLTIRALERLSASDEARHHRFRNLLDGLESPSVLVLALLLHDVGKWCDDEHAPESVRMADAALTRLARSSGERDQVLFLIGHHLRMSLAAFRRDTEDPEIVRDFAEVVGTEERLKMLCLLTFADVDGVAPGTLTPWKEELLWRLYVDTYNELTQRYGDELIVPDQRGIADLLEDRPADLSAAEIRTFVEGLPRRYLQVFPREAVHGHVRLARDIRPGDAHVSLDRSGPVWSLVVATQDTPGLFSNICGVLASFGMNILRGHALTNPNGVVLDVFQFTDDEQFLALNPGAPDHVRRVLADVVTGRAEVGPRLRGREEGIVRSRPHIPPVLRIDNRVSSRYTIVDIIAGNAVGLLYRISRVIARQGCAVGLVLIATEGERAVDVFHITHEGAKLTGPAQDALAAALTQTLQEDP